MNYNNKMNYKFAIVDQNNVRNLNKELYEYVLEKTVEASKKLSYNVEVYSTVDEAVRNNTGVVVIQHVGNFIKDNKFVDYLEEYIKNNPNFFALAFTLDWMPEQGEGYIELHGQMMVINTKIWKEIGSPEYGDWTHQVKIVPTYTRSPENFHDKYTPHWIEGTGGLMSRLVKHPGWGFLEAALSEKLRIDNFTEEMRKCRLYVYPEYMSNEFLTAIKNKNPDLVENFNQKQYIRDIK